MEQEFNPHASSADYGLTEIAMEGEEARYKQDSGVICRFYMHPRLDQNASNEAQRPIFNDTEYVEITVPMDKENIVRRPASDFDKRRFPKHYEAFKAGVEAQGERGTPVSLLPGITMSMIEELKYFKVFNIEQLAAISDQNASQMMGLNTLKAQATEYLDRANASVTAKELDATKAELAELRAMIEGGSGDEDDMEEPAKAATRRRVKKD